MSLPLHLRRPLTIVLAALAAMIGLGAMYEASATASSTQVLHISAKGGAMLRFNTTRLRAHPGRVTIVMSNPSGSGISHGIALKGPGVNKVGPTVAPGHSASVTATVRKGSYEFYCPVPGHAMAGMKGTLTVS
jgi:uncharacterized cupredoxin-like copper-binding protein